MPKVLFVCTANCCRSPLASAILRHLLARDGSEEGWGVKSAGVEAVPGSSASEEAVAAARELGVDLSTHRAGQLSEELARWADHILVMEPRHARCVREHFPEHASKVRLLAAFGAGHGQGDTIEDPINYPPRHFPFFLENLRQAVEGFYRSLRTA